MTPPARKPSVQPQKVQRRAVAFADRAAIERSPDAMQLFRELDGELNRYMASMRPGAQPLPGAPLAEKMRAVIAADERFVTELPEDDEPDEPEGVTPPRPRSTRDELLAFVNELEDGRALKRKRSQSASADESRKRPKLEELEPPLTAAPSETLPSDPVDLWWELMRTDAMLGAGVPQLPAATKRIRRVKQAKVAGKRTVSKKKK